MKKNIVTIGLIALLAGCSRQVIINPSAPSVVCESQYSAEAETGFNLLEWISVQSQGSKSHVTIRGDLDNTTPGDYSVLLTAYDDNGNITIRNVDIEITERIEEPEPEIEEVEEVAEEPVEEVEEETPEPSPEPSPTQKPSPSHMPKPQANVNTAPADPYAQAKADCAASYGVWNGTACEWPQPAAPQPSVSEQATNPYGLTGGSTSCWQEGNMTVCEWVGEWEEYD
ncbi:MAG: hypothetical protein IJ225_06510 [Solobacterium sp.]|nr:hypothetical protein [Solobacterium sp.]